MKNNEYEIMAGDDKRKNLRGAMTFQFLRKADTHSYANTPVFHVDNISVKYHVKVYSFNNVL